MTKAGLIAALLLGSCQQGSTTDDRPWALPGWEFGERDSGNIIDITGTREPAIDVTVLHAKIGELTLANDFLAGALGKAAAAAFVEGAFLNRPLALKPVPERPLYREAAKGQA